MKAYMIALVLALIIGLNGLPASAARIHRGLSLAAAHSVQPCGPQGDTSG